ncbi:unnamed protein product [Blepharisma stoltei]|uniref:FZ domain-containing protein n=1 Tax=Blepharisma stoltei TaxID=1481888 RepID=A0AAU9JHH8_9CILI|nr:unnamed protein product [Blepharisma stoltei]
MITLIFSLFITTESCQLSTLAKGKCVSSSTLPLDFCSNKVGDQVCIPLSYDNWPEWNVSAKDSAIRDAYIASLEKRLTEEIDGKVQIVFTRNSECVKIYKEIMCKANFPSCDGNNTYLPCNNLCDFFQSVCYIQDNPCDTLNSTYEYMKKCSFSFILSVSLYFLYI